MARRGLSLSAVLLLLAGLFSAVPKIVSADSGDAPSGTPEQATQSLISAGTQQACVIVNTADISGGVKCWGGNTWGYLGDGTQTTRNRPVTVMDSKENPTTPLSGAVSVLALENNTCALMNTGKVKCWGFSAYGGLGIDTSLLNGASFSAYPVYVKSSGSWTSDLTGAISISGGTYGVCALLATGNVNCWGDYSGHSDWGPDPFLVQKCNYDASQLPNSSPCQTTYGAPWLPSTPRQPIENVQQINGNNQDMCFISNAQLACLGNNRNGEFATGRDDNYASGYPEPSGSSTNGIEALAVGDSGACGLFNVGANGGSIKCWGNNDSGAVGVGTSVRKYTTAQAVGIDNAVAISGDFQTFCALLKTNDVKCWGNNNRNQMGTTGTVKTSPIPVMSNVRALSVGREFICFVMLDTTIQCLGDNQFGEIGIGTTGGSVSTPQPVLAETGSSSLSGASIDAVAPTSSGTPTVSTDGLTITIPFSESLSPITAPTSAFTVLVNGGPVTASSINVNGSSIEIVFLSAIGSGDTVSVTYNDPSADNDSAAIQDSSYNDVASFGPISATNNSTQAPTPTTQAPTTTAAPTTTTTSTTTTTTTTVAPTTTSTTTSTTVAPTTTSTTVAPTTTSTTVAPTTTSTTVAPTTTTSTTVAPTSTTTTTSTPSNTSTTIPATSTTTTTQAPTTTQPPTNNSQDFVPLEKPERILDTRSLDPIGELDGSGDALSLQVAGRRGVPNNGFVAVALNVTVVSTEAADVGGYVTVYPCGTRPESSNLNFITGQIVPNSVISPLSDEGKVCFYVFGKAKILADITGYFVTGFTPLPKPERLLDTRGVQKVGTLDGTGAAYRLRVAGQKGLPASGLQTVAFNLTVVNGLAPDVGGYVTAYPCGVVPDSSNLNFKSGQTLPNAVIAPVSAEGDLCFYVYGSGDLLVDIFGYFTNFTTLTKPERLLDTRSAQKIGSFDGNGTAYTLRVFGNKGLPDSGVGTLGLNVTAVDGEASDVGGYVTVYPCGTRSESSNVNFINGQTVPNAVIAPVSSDGNICIYVYGKAHILVDTAGYFSSGFEVA